jgi:hypothetical protein
MDADTVGDVLYSTVLAKIVKSQQWMRATSTLPREFIVFCWLPPVGAYQTCLEQSDALLWTEALLWNVRAGGWPFTLRLMVPIDPGGIFPDSFGLYSNRHTQTKMLYYMNDLCYNVNAEDFEEDGVEDEEPMQWFLFAEEFDEVEEDAESEARSSSPTVCMKELIPLIDRLLENFEHRERAELLPLFLGFRAFGAFVDPQLLGTYANNHPCFESARSAKVHERDRASFFPPLLRGLPWWDVKGLQRWQVGLPGWLDPPISIELCSSTKRHAVCCLTFCF